MPDEPIVPYIEGDGIGVDIWPAAQLVLDAAAAKHGKHIAWKEVLAGEKAFKETGEWLPEETVEAFRDHLIGIKGPLTTPVGGGFRSLNVALRQLLDLYVCLRPVRWFAGVPSPVVHPEKVDMVIFRENTEDVYAGLELQEGTEEARRLIAYLEEQFGWTIRPDSGIGIKPISETGSKRLVRAAAAVRRAPPPARASRSCTRATSRSSPRGRSATGATRSTRDEFSDVAVGWDDCGGQPGDKILVKDAIADITFQQVLDPARRVRRHRRDEPERRLPLRRPGGTGRGHRDRARRQHQLRHRATASSRRRTARPRSTPARTKSTPARCCCPACSCSSTSDGRRPPTTSSRRSKRTIADKIVTYDFARLMEGAHEVRCSQFAEAIVERL